MTSRLSGRTATPWVLAVVGVSLLTSPGPARAWGPHHAIAAAALAVMPEAKRWQEALGNANYESLAPNAGFGDWEGYQHPGFFNNDYIYFRGAHRGHAAPLVKLAVTPQYERALQALRTEEPREACRRMYAMTHYAEDAGSPPHAKPDAAPHAMENWPPTNRVAIPDYRPRLLGRTDAEAMGGLNARLDGLIAYSVERAVTVESLMRGGETNPAALGLIVLESAQESARVLADLYFTLFTLGLDTNRTGAVLEGRILAAPAASLEEKHSQVALLDAAAFDRLRDARAPESRVLYESATAFSTFTGTGGVYRFHNLPDGTYRVLGYRVGSQPVVSEPVTLARGRSARADLDLPAAAPPGNLVQNPEGRMALVAPDAPDAWRRHPRVDALLGRRPAFYSELVRIPPQTPVRCGAALADPSARVHFYVSDTGDLSAGKYETGLTVPTPDSGSPETIYRSGETRKYLVVAVESDKPFTEAVSNVWVAAEPGGGLPP